MLELVLVGLGLILFPHMTTGPDGVGDYNVHVEEQFFVGYGSMSPEASSDTQYLYRAAPVSAVITDNQHSAENRATEHDSVKCNSV